MGYKIIPPVPGTSVTSVPITINALTTAGNATDCEQASNVTTVTLTGITVAAGSNRGLIVAVVWQIDVTSRVVTALVGGTPTAMTEENYGLNGVGGAVGLYSIANPSTGVQSIVATWVSQAAVYLSAICVNNFGSVNGADDQTSTTTAVTIPSAAKDATVAAIVTDNGDPTSSQTLSFAESILPPGGGADYALGGVSNTHTFGNAGTNRRVIGIHLVAA
jgi:hypothetical protein